MPNGNPEYQIGVLSTRVAGIEQQFTALSGQISGLAAKIDEQAKGFSERGRVNWIAIGSLFFAAVGTSVAVIAVLGALARAPLDQGIADLKSTTANLAQAIDKTNEAKLSRGEFEEFKRTYEANRANFKLDNNTRLAGIEGDIQKNADLIRQNEKEVVPRGEHERVWLSIDKQIEAVQRQINDLKESQGSTYGVRDVIQRLEKQVEELRDERKRAAAP